jgi:hypothetical protein
MTQLGLSSAFSGRVGERCRHEFGMKTAGSWAPDGTRLEGEIEFELPPQSAYGD